VSNVKAFLGKKTLDVLLILDILYDFGTVYYCNNCMLLLIRDILCTVWNKKCPVTLIYFPKLIIYC